MNLNGSSGAVAPALVKDERKHAVLRTVVSLSPKGDKHVSIGFAGADGVVRYADARIDRALPVEGQVAMFHGYLVPSGAIEWRLGYVGDANVESAKTAANA